MEDEEFDHVNIAPIPLAEALRLMRERGIKIFLGYDVEVLLMSVSGEGEKNELEKVYGESQE